VAEYDRGHTLVIDPALEYSTYLNGAYNRTAAVDSFGNVYITGMANLSLPTTPGVLQH
jgi:hypothetical protein